MRVGGSRGDHNENPQKYLLQCNLNVKKRPLLRGRRVKFSLFFLFPNENFQKDFSAISYFL